MSSHLYHSEQDLQLVQACVDKNLPTLLMGETGTGKTTLVKELAVTKSKQFIRINLNGQTTREDLVGKYQLVDGNTVWQDGILLHGVKNGFWILLDEINAALPEVLLVLQALLESNKGTLGSIVLAEKDGEVVPSHTDTRIFATCNPSDYIGMKDFNQATLSRFVVLHIDPLDREEEAKLLTEKHGIDAKKSQQLSLFSESLRKLKKEQRISLFVSTRDLEQVVLLHLGGIDLYRALNVCVIAKTPNEAEQGMIRDTMKQVMEISEDKLEKMFGYEKKMKALEKKKKELENSFNALNSEFKEVQDSLQVSI